MMLIRLEMEEGDANDSDSEKQDNPDCCTGGEMHVGSNKGSTDDKANHDCGTGEDEGGKGSVCVCVCHVNNALSCTLKLACIVWYTFSYTTRYTSCSSYSVHTMSYIITK